MDSAQEAKVMLLIQCTALLMFMHGSVCVRMRERVDYTLPYNLMIREVVIWQHIDRLHM